MSVMDIRLKPAILDHYDLPDILYPISLSEFNAALFRDGDWPLASMLRQLQERSRVGDAAWLRLEPAMDRLAQILAPDDQQPVLAATGAEWWIKVGPVDLDDPIVTIQREDKLIAAISATAGGRLRVSAYRPLDAKSLSYLTRLSTKPHGEHGVRTRENNWEYALDCSAGNGNFYAFMRGEAHLSYWEFGIGYMADGTIDAHWQAMNSLAHRLPAVVVAELVVYHSYAPA